MNGGNSAPTEGTPTVAGAAASQASMVAHAAFSAMFYDTRLGTLQQVPAPIAHLDVVHPYPLPLHPIVPMPGDPGAYATAQALEDR
jgi:hypothetical protein